MKIVLAILCGGWCIALGMWLSMIINKDTREKANYALIALLILNLAIQIYAYVI
ncbi:MAG: hypothetical protein UHO61_05110 [Acutalibacteraceae bacterium]|nr:hypothetical protein [Acutalibacteraceae bacterium]